jgi:peptidyl-prolyl cis-trans isomerase C
MQRRRDDSIRGRIARARARIRGRQPVATRIPPPPKRRVPRREIEARRQRMLRWGVAIAGVVVVALIAGGVLYDQVIKPNQTLATVGANTISRADYWKTRASDLYEQGQQYQDFARFVGPDQQNQYLALAQQSLAQIPTVWGSTDIDAATLAKMIDDQVYLQGMGALGLESTPDEIHTFALNRFAPPGAPLIPASPTPTLTAERAAMAMRTAVALLATPVGSPIVGTPIAGTPAATPGVAMPGATPDAGTPGATPLAGSPTPAPATPNPDAALATAEAGYAQFADAFFALSHLSQADYERLVAAPALARQKVADALASTIGQSAPQVHASHMLVPTREEADAARARVTGGEDFATVAREVSTDQATAGNGGDLGWFAREEMIPAFAHAAFALEPGAISQPVETEFGWHIITVAESDPDRPLTDAQIQRIKQAHIDRWVEEERAAFGVTSTLPPSPTPFASTFQPPVGAPPPPTPTPLPATPAATPVG